MQDSEPKPRISFGGKTDKYRQVKLSVIYTKKDDVTMQIQLMNKTLNDDSFRDQKMTKDGQYYTIQLILKENCVYKYYYEAIDNTSQKKDTELQCRYFQFAETEKIQVDQWNKIWCLYRIRPKSSEIFQAYQIQVKNSQNGEYFELKKSAIIFPAKDYQELMDNDLTQKIRQFSLISKINRKEALSSNIQIENINQFKMNNLYVEFEMHQFQQDIALEIKDYLQIFETNQEWNLHDQIQVLKQQVQQANTKISDLEQENRRLNGEIRSNELNLIQFQCQIKKLQEDHNKEIKIFKYTFEQEKSALTFLHSQKMNNLTEDFNKKFKQLQDQAIIENNQYQEDFNQFQNIATKKINEYIEKLQQQQNTIRIYELQLHQLKNDKINNIDNNSQFNEQILLTLCDTDEQATSEETDQIKSLKEKLQLYEKNMKDLNTQKLEIGQELEQELKNQKILKSSFKQKIKKYLNEQDNCIQNLEQTKKELQEYIQKNKLLEQTSLKQTERFQNLQKLLEIVKHKNKELQQFKEQYQELLLKYEDQIEQYKQLEDQKKKDDIEFEKFKEEKSQQLNLIVSNYQKQIEIFKNENEILIQNQKAEQLQIIKQQQQVFRECSEEILENVFNEILRPYQINQDIFSKNLTRNLDSEISNIQCLIIQNFETTINIAADGINIITNNSFNNLKEDLIQIHAQIISQIHDYKEYFHQSSLRSLLQHINEFQKKLLEIKDFAYSVENMLQQDQDQIGLISNNCQTLEKILDIVLKLNTLLEGKNDELKMLLQSQNEITKIFENFQQKSLTQINSAFFRMDLETK